MPCCTDWPREHDPELHDFYARKLLEPGWGGEVTSGEVAYIQRELLKEKSLSRIWGFRARQKSRSEAAIRRIAMGGDPEDRKHNQRLIRPGRVAKSSSAASKVSKLATKLERQADG